MFTKNELKTTKEYIRQKKDEILDSKIGTDADYIKDLQTLIQLENAVDEKIEKFFPCPGKP